MLKDLHVCDYRARLPRNRYQPPGPTRLRGTRSTPSTHPFLQPTRTHTHTHAHTLTRARTCSSAACVLATTLATAGAHAVPGLCLDTHGAASTIQAAAAAVNAVPASAKAVPTPATAKAAAPADPWPLGYVNLTTPLSGPQDAPGFARSTVHFPCGGVKCEAWLYAPKRPAGAKPAPLILMANGVVSARRARAQGAGGLGAPAPCAADAPIGRRAAGGASWRPRQFETVDLIRRGCACARTHARGGGSERTLLQLSTPASPAKLNRARCARIQHAHTCGAPASNRRAARRTWACSGSPSRWWRPAPPCLCLTTAPLEAARACPATGGRRRAAAGRSCAGCALVWARFARAPVPPAPRGPPAPRSRTRCPTPAPNTSCNPTHHFRTRRISAPRHIEDWLSAADFVQGPGFAATAAEKGIDASKLGLWGSSFGGGHVIVVAAKLGERVSAVVSQVSAVFIKPLKPAKAKNEPV